MAPHLVLEFENGLINLSLSAGALRALLNAGKKPLRLIIPGIHLLRDLLILSSTVLLTYLRNVRNPQLSHRVFCSCLLALRVHRWSRLSLKRAPAALITAGRCCVWHGDAVQYTAVGPAFQNGIPHESKSPNPGAWSAAR